MPTESTGTQTVRTIAPPTRSSRWVTSLSALPNKAKKALTAPAAPAISAAGLSFSTMSGAGLNPRSQPSETAAAAPVLDSAASELDRTSAFTSRALSDSSVNAKAEMRESMAGGWRISSGRLVRPGEPGTWVEACPGSAALEITAFTAHGSDLWAGGGNGTLLHSRDGGASCEQTTLGASATGAIARIEAHGAVVLVKSSSGQSWTSQDGGKTWKMNE